MPCESMPELVQLVMLAAPGPSSGCWSRHSRSRRRLAVVWPQFVAPAAIGSGLVGYAFVRFRSTIGTMA